MKAHPTLGASPLKGIVVSVPLPAPFNVHGRVVLQLAHRDTVTVHKEDDGATGGLGQTALDTGVTGDGTHGPVGGRGQAASWVPDHGTAQMTGRTGCNQHWGCLGCLIMASKTSNCLSVCLS